MRSKRTKTLLGLALPALAAVGLAVFGFAPSTEAGGEVGAKASFVKGQVEIGPSADGPFKKLRKKKPVKVGYFVRTGPESRAELKFSDGSVLRLGPESLLEMQAGQFNAKTKEVGVEATLVAGKVWAKVSKLVGSDAKFKVKTQNAVAGVRGTIFRVNTERDKATVVKVYQGAVAVSNNPFFAKKGDKATAGSGLGRGADVKQIAPPFQEISKKEWEQVVGRMMVVKVGADGKMADASRFTKEEDKVEDPEWVNWNLACDIGAKDCEAY